MKKEKIKSVIIGSNGYIGKNLSFFLHSLKIDNNDYDINDHTAYSWMNYSKLDITKKNDFYKIDKKTNVIFFMAGLTGTEDGFSNYENYFNINVIGLINLLTFLKERKLKVKIIFPSTRLVYQGKKNIPLKEYDEKNPKSIYALTKLSAENTLKLYSKLFNINYNIFRICVPYANFVNNDYSYGTIGFFLSRANNGKKISLYGNGEGKRTFTHISDICNILFNSVTKPLKNNEVYNIGGEEYSLFEVANKIAEKYSSEIEFVKWPKTSLMLETGDTIFNSEKLDSEINYKSYESLEIWIEKINQK